MQIIRRPKALRQALLRERRRGRSVGFVPTMGYLHEGHLALVRQSRQENDLTIVSIFVNPLQFGPSEDLRRYPRDLGRDRRALETAKADILFCPDVEDMYPKAFQTSVSVSKLSGPLCGRTRPIHFGGVATVVLKLLHLTTPDRLYLGQKDYQQFCVVRQMVRDLGLPVQVRMVPIVREPDGLAMSSRNIYLSPEERREAVALHQALKAFYRKVRAGERSAAALRRVLLRELFRARRGRVEYAEIVHAETLEPMVKLAAKSKVLAALAVRFSKARLIDNILVKV